MIPLAKPDLTGNELEYVTEAIRSGWISKGEFVERFEKGLSEVFGAYAISCSSGTGALHLACLASGCGEYIVPDLTFAATGNVALAVGLLRLADVDDHGAIAPPQIIRALTPSTKAIVPVHLYGLFCDMDAIMEIARHRNLIVIEDAAEVTRPFEVRGDYACMSFYGNKAISTGEGGAVLTKDRKKAERIRLFRDHGMVRPYHHIVPGLNYRLTNLQAAVGCAQLERYFGFLKRRDRILRRYRESIPGWGDWLWVAPKREIEGVETRPVFDPLHLQPPYRSGGEFPNAERIWRESFCLPCGPHLSDDDVETIIAAYLHRLRPETARGLSGPASFHRHPVIKAGFDHAADPGAAST